VYIHIVSRGSHKTVYSVDIACLTGKQCWSLWAWCNELGRQRPHVSSRQVTHLFTHLSPCGRFYCPWHRRQIYGSSRY